MTSREIAELTGKRHSNVLRDARKMLDNLQLERKSFLSFDHSGANGRRIEYFFLTKDLTLTLVSGYDVVMRHKIVKRWQELEAL